MGRLHVPRGHVWLLKQRTRAELNSLRRVQLHGGGGAKQKKKKYVDSHHCVSDYHGDEGVFIDLDRWREGFPITFGTCGPDRARSHPVMLTLRRASSYQETVSCWRDRIGNPAWDDRRGRVGSQVIFSRAEKPPTRSGGGAKGVRIRKERSKDPMSEREGVVPKDEGIEALRVRGGDTCGCV